MSNVKLKVLVADDAAAIHALFRKMAEHSPIPFELLRAENGRECMDALARGGIHLAFIDVNMPEMSGMEAVGAARHAGNKTFVTLMSTVRVERRLKVARQLKVYEFLKKPFAEADVMQILRTYRRVTTPVNALIVDDSKTVRRIVQKVLTNSIFNIEVTEAGNGEAAVECCESGDFDVVFVDCNMPGINGVETLERLIENDPGAKVIMMTSERNEERRRWALDRGATAFLYKPFYARDIDRELHALFGLRLPELTEEPEAAHLAAPKVTAGP